MRLSKATIPLCPPEHIFTETFFFSQAFISTLA